MCCSVEYILWPNNHLDSDWYCDNCHHCGSMENIQDKKEKPWWLTFTHSFLFLYYVDYNDI